MIIEVVAVTCALFQCSADGKMMAEQIDNALVQNKFFTEHQLCCIALPNKDAH